ncbi:MAG: hypothetical protein KC668_13420 [Myxococcales bacterium]|nr:hypothetical protein [Myxococcales bacterium]
MRSLHPVHPRLPGVATLTLCGLAAFALGCGGRGCGGEDPALDTRQALPTATFTLAIVTDLKGYLEPCGCTSRPLGGIDRLAAQVIATRGAGPTLTLLAGDLFFSGQSHGPHVGEAASAPDGPGSFAARARAGQDALSAEAVADVLLRLEAGAALPGPHDLENPAALTALAERAHLRLLGVGETQAVLRTVGEQRVLVIGVAEEDPQAAEATLRALLDDPRYAERSLAVVMTRGGRRGARALARVSGVDVVIMGGADVDEPLPPSEVGDALVLHASRQGQGLTLARVYVPPGARGTDPGRPSVLDISLWSVEVRRGTLEADIAELEGNIRRWEEEAADPARVAQQRARLDAMRAELATLTAPPLPPDRRAVSAEFVELPPDAPREASITEAMEALARRVNDHNRVALAEWVPEPASAGQPHYLGSASCESCHTAAFAWWRNHPHGRAYSTLEVRHKEFNLSCVGCHVTGYLQPGGSTVTQLGAEGALRNVGCENCHGPASAHVESQGTIPPPRRDVPEAVCVGCHNEEHSDRFVYEVYRRTLLVPGHGLPEAEAGANP